MSQSHAVYHGLELIVLSILLYLFVAFVFVLIVACVKYCSTALHWQLLEAMSRRGCRLISTRLLVTLWPIFAVSRKQYLAVTCHASPGGSSCDLPVAYRLLLFLLSEAARAALVLIL